MRIFHRDIMLTEVTEGMIVSTFLVKMMTFVPLLQTTAGLKNAGSMDFLGDSVHTGMKTIERTDN